MSNPDQLKAAGEKVQEALAEFGEDATSVAATLGVVVGAYAAATGTPARFLAAVNRFAAGVLSGELTS